MKAGDEAFVSEVLHDLSQAVTALEVGLEIGLRQDKSVAEMRQRMRTLLGVAQSLHQNLLDLRAAQDGPSRNGDRTHCARRTCEIKS